MLFCMTYSMIFLRDHAITIISTLNFHGKFLKDIEVKINIFFFTFEVKILYLLLKDIKKSIMIIKK